MSVRLIEKNIQCPDCRLRKLKLHVCRKCLVVVFSTVLTRTARCPECHTWLRTEKEVKSAVELPGFYEWYAVDLRSEFDFICTGFTKHRGNILSALQLQQQLFLPGLERRKSL